MEHQPNNGKASHALERWEAFRALNLHTTELLQRHLSDFARRQYKARHGSIDDSKPTKWYLDQLHVPAPATQKKYLTSGRRQIELAMAAGTSPWQVIESNAGSKNSWNTRRAAVQFYVVARMSELKRVIDRFARLDSRHAVSPAEMRVVAKELPFLAKALESLPQTAPLKFQPGSDFKPVRMSKSRSLHKAPPDWDEQVTKKLSSSYYLPYWLVQCATGCRPQELSNGFSIERRSDGTLCIEVLGAKVGPTSGQARRSVLLSVANEGWAVKQLAAKLPPNKVLSGLRQGRSVGAYCQAIKRACKATFPHLQLSAYSARHQKKADLKKAGLDRVALAKFLGHRTTRSAVHYGRAVRGRAGSVKPVAVRATHAVNVRAQYVPRRDYTPQKQAQSTKKPPRARLRR